MWTHFRWLLADHGKFYGPTSGWVPDLTMLGIVGGYYHKHNCHEDGCWRIGRHTVMEADGSHVLRCRRHHRRSRQNLTTT